MKSVNPYIHFFKLIMEMLKEAAYFPVWWFTRGYLTFLKRLGSFLADKNKAIGLTVWIKNYFRPMYGQRSVSGVLISIAMRTVQIIFRGIAMLFWLAVSAGLAISWVLLPFFAAYEIYFQTFG